MTTTPKPSDHPSDPYIRAERLPSLWCPGCGIGTSLNCFIRALQKENIPPEEVLTVSGIGCTGRASSYLNTDGFHSVHGRALPFAIGAKLTKPELKVVVFSGDGDLFAIGGNHFLHAARRNVPMTVICMNNSNFGMTGGQTAPTTPIGSKTATTPLGATLPPLNLVSVAAGAGAIFVARYTSAHPIPLTQAIRTALKTNGFAFIEAFSPCHTLFGKFNQLGGARDIANIMREKSFRATALELSDLRQAKIEFKPDEGFVRIPIGEFVNRQHVDG